MQMSMYLYTCKSVYFDLHVHAYFRCVALQQIAVAAAVCLATCAAVCVAVCVAVFYSGLPCVAKCVAGCIALCLVHSRSL